MKRSDGGPVPRFRVVIHKSEEEDAVHPWHAHLIEHLGPECAEHLCELRHWDFNLILDAGLRMLQEAYAVLAEFGVQQLMEDLDQHG